MTQDLPRRFRSCLFALAVAGLLAVPATRTALAEDPGATTLPTDAKDRKGFKDLVSAARTYFDLLEDAWVGRKPFLAELEELAKKNHYPLADPPFLRWLVDQSRSFEPQMDDSKWYKANDLAYTDHNKFHGFELKSRDLWVHVRPADSYPKKNKDLESYERPGPWPLVFSMHGKDHAGDGAGKELVASRWSKDLTPDIQKDWIIAVPIAAAAAYSDNGRIRMERVHTPLRRVYESYHVDFDRIILDGGQDALLLLATSPWLFAGAVLREGALDTPKLQASVANFCPVPLYVVDQPALAQALRDAGHANVTEGKASDAPAWMAQQRRHDPKSFDWVTRESDQVLAWYINLDQPLWDEGIKRHIHVDIVDTAEEPNTVKITAEGMAELSVYLNDTLVDLDRPVRIVINGVTVKDEALQLEERMSKVKRDFDAIFQARGGFNPIDVRKSRYYGWLRSAFFVRIPVPAPAEDAGDGSSGGAGDSAGPTATEKQVADAARLLGKAKDLKDSNADRAKDLLRKVLEMPETPSHDEARKLLEELGG